MKHAIYDETTNICMITKDPQRQYKDAVKELSLPIDKVVGLSKLRAKFKAYQSRRELCGSYQLFLADDRILPALPGTIGKAFFDAKKIPIPINLKKNLKDEVDEIMNSTFLMLGKGSCV